MQALGLAVRHTVKLCGAHRQLWLPFVIAALVEAGVIFVLWLAPQPPFSIVLAPPVRFVFTERALHYPWHLWYLFHTMKHAQFAAAVISGAFMTGIACVMVRQTHQAVPLSFRDALVSGQVRYSRVVLIWAASWALAQGVSSGLNRVLPAAEWGMWLTLGLTVLLQMLLVYAIPASVFDRVGWLKAFWRSIRETFRAPLGTLIVVGIPSAAVIAFEVCVPSATVAKWMAATTPEIAVALVAARLLLWTAADAWMTVGASHLWLYNRSM